ncbi:MAG: hypothetical protein ACT4QB_16935, partial [Gammaproteobacteria bacterium]
PGARRVPAGWHARGGPRGRARRMVLVARPDGALGRRGGQWPGARHEVLSSGLVEHVGAAGYHYRPSERVDWMVYDIADRPGRVAALVARYLLRSCHAGTMTSGADLRAHGAVGALN